MFGDVLGSLVAALVIVLLAACQPTAARRAVAGIYVAINTGHLLGLSWWLDGHAYFITAAGADALIMWLIVRRPRLSAIGVPLLRICVAEFAINALWWAWWWHGDGYNPVAYNAVYQGLQLWLMWILIRRDRANEWGRYKVDHGRDLVRAIAGARPHNLPGRSAPPCRRKATF